jgi:uncharacterized protein (DUF849 family)
MYNKGMQKVIVNFTPTGMIPTKDMTPHVPITPSEIIEQVHEASDLGITLVHLHTRTGSGQPNYRAATYQKIIDGIKTHCPELVICVSLSGRKFGEFEKRSEVIELRPDMGSLTLGSLNSPKVAITNSPEMIQRLAEKMEDYGVQPELEAFDAGMINYGKYLIKKGVLKPPYYFNLIFGMISNAQADPAYIGLAIRDLPDCLWSLGGVGDSQLRVNTLGIAFNGGVRVGLEDTIYYDADRRTLATNMSLLRRIHHIIKLFDREVMTPQEFGKKGFYNEQVRDIGAL